MPFAGPGQTILTIGGRRVVVGGSGVRNYAAWQAEATRLATNGFKDFNTNFNSGDRPAVYKTTATTPNNTLFGSPWGGRAFSVNFGSIGRVVQHGMQSQALFNEQVAGGYDIVVQIASAATQNVLSFARNGYTSLDSTANPDAFAATCPLLIRWDNTLQKAFQSNPFAGSAETEYVW